MAHDHQSIVQCQVWIGDAQRRIEDIASAQESYEAAHKKVRYSSGPADRRNLFAISIKLHELHWQTDDIGMSLNYAEAAYEIWANEREVFLADDETYVGALEEAIETLREAFNDESAQNQFKEQQRRRASAQWQAAKSENYEDAYVRYIGDWPEGESVREARQRLAGIRRANFRPEYPDL